jgi:hypothetical protein
MHREKQDEIIGCAADQGNPQREFARQIEWPAELVGRQRLDTLLPLLGRQRRHIRGSPTDLRTV